MKALFLIISFIVTLVGAFIVCLIDGDFGPFYLLLAFTSPITAILLLCAFMATITSCFVKIRNARFDRKADKAIEDNGLKHCKIFYRYPLLLIDDKNQSIFIGTKNKNSFSFKKIAFSSIISYEYTFDKKDELYDNVKLTINVRDIEEPLYVINFGQNFKECEICFSTLKAVLN